MKNLENVKLMLEHQNFDKATWLKIIDTLVDKETVVDYVMNFVDTYRFLNNAGIENQLPSDVESFKAEIKQEYYDDFINTICAITIDMEANNFALWSGEYEVSDEFGDAEDEERFAHYGHMFYWDNEDFCFETASKKVIAIIREKKLEKLS